MMIVQGLLVALVFYVISLLSLSWCANPMLDRPIVLGPLVGLVLGDLQQGILLGASIELIFLGVASIGPSMPANAGLDCHGIRYSNRRGNGSGAGSRRADWLAWCLHL